MERINRGHGHTQWIETVYYSDMRRVAYVYHCSCGRQFHGNGSVERHMSRVYEADYRRREAARKEP